jgi:hypothetical protein
VRWITKRWNNIVYPNYLLTQHEIRNMISPSCRSRCRVKPLWCFMILWWSSGDAQRSYRRKHSGKQWSITVDRYLCKKERDGVSFERHVMYDGSCPVAPHRAESWFLHDMYCSRILIGRTSSIRSSFARNLIIMMQRGSALVTRVPWELAPMK